MLEEYQEKELCNGAYGIVKKNALLADYTTLAIGGRCPLLIEPTSEKELLRTWRFLKCENIPYYIFGRGSNILVLDGGFPGVVIVLGPYFSDCWIEGTTVIVQAGNSIHDVAEMTFQAGLTGMEELSGIPGSIGGGVFMNAGAYGREMKDVVESIRAINRDGELITLTSEEMDMSYRRSRMMEDNMVVTELTLRLEEGEPEEIWEKYRDYTQRRETKQPLDKRSAGSTFKRPKEGYASALIDQSDLRGYRIGGAQVSEKHCGFLINDDHASADDMLTLIHYVQDVVWQKHHIRLEPEVRIIGEDK